MRGWKMVVGGAGPAVHGVDVVRRRVPASGGRGEGDGNGVRVHGAGGRPVRDLLQPRGAHAAQGPERDGRRDVRAGERRGVHRDDAADRRGVPRARPRRSLDFLIPNAYYTRTTSDGYIAYGVGIFAPFGLGQEYENKNTSIFRNQITKIDLQTVVVNPTIAFKINEYLSVGAGIDWMWGQAKLEKTPVAPGVGNLYNSELKGDGDAWGYNFGVLLKPTENFRIGANYRSPFTLKIKDGDVTISNTSTGVRIGPAWANPGKYERQTPPSRCPPPSPSAPRTRWAS